MTEDSENTGPEAATIPWETCATPVIEEWTAVDIDDAQYSPSPQDMQPTPGHFIESLHRSDVRTAEKQEKRRGSSKRERSSRDGADVSTSVDKSLVAVAMKPDDARLEDQDGSRPDDEEASSDGDTIIEDWSKWRREDSDTGSTFRPSTNANKESAPSENPQQGETRPHEKRSTNPIKKNKDQPWQPHEKEYVRLLMREILSERVYHRTEQKWPEISRRLLSRYKIDRSKGSIKNHWNRQGRQESGIDERVKRKTPKLQTGYQDPDVRKKERKQKKEHQQQRESLTANGRKRGLEDEDSHDGVVSERAGANSSPKKRQKMTSL